MTKHSNAKKAAVEVFGFYATSEGRSFLRFCYARYLDCLKAKYAEKAPSHGKVGMVVADQSENQQAEDNRTAQALRRWLEEGKAEIWHGNMPATIRICQRLEALIAEEEEVSQIMGDRTSSIKRTRFLSGVSDFFLPKRSSYDSAVVRQRLEQYSGVYTIWTYAPNDRWDPYYHMTDTHCRIEAHKELPILSLQEFDLISTRDEPIVRNRKVGFVFTDDESNIFRFLISYRNPNVRWVEVLTAAILPELPIFKASDKRFNVNAYGVNQNSQEEAMEIRQSLRVLGRSNVDDLLFCRSDAAMESRANEIFASIQWDVMI